MKSLMLRIRIVMCVIVAMLLQSCIESEEYKKAEKVLPKLEETIKQKYKVEYVQARIHNSDDLRIKILNADVNKLSKEEQKEEAHQLAKSSKEFLNSLEPDFTTKYKDIYILFAEGEEKGGVVVSDFEKVSFRLSEL